jgi:hypothetical protein
MDKEDIIRMAREAGLLVVGTADGGEAVYTWPKGITDELECFAALVAAEKEKQIIDILRRLQERNDSHNYYAYAINVIKGETHENPYLYTIRL